MLNKNEQNLNVNKEQMIDKIIFLTGYFKGIANLLYDENEEPVEITESEDEKEST